MLDKYQFDFLQRGYGQYEVEYTTRRGDYFRALITNMSLTDDVKYEEYPTQVALRRLARAVRYGGSHFSKHGVLLES